jgi:ribonuclease P protein component
MNFTFKKQERLCSKKLIDEVFSKGKSISKFPFKLVFLQTDLNTGFPIQVGFSVPKKYIKKAVDRNLIKRKMREAYRLNKHLFYQDLNEKDRHYAAFLIYLSKEQLTFEQIEDKTNFLFDRLVKMT